MGVKKKKKKILKVAQAPSCCQTHFLTVLGTGPISQPPFQVDLAMGPSSNCQPGPESSPPTPTGALPSVA